MPYLSIYRASAGSGKTHTLTQEYLKLSFENPEKFAHILAVTFTNKAADEMKKRILSELNSIAIQGNKNAHYKVIKDKHSEKTEEMIKSDAESILSNILHQYSRFSVSTIDSFTQRVLRAFSFELGLQSGYKVEMDEGHVLNELTEILYKRIGTDKQLRKWLLRYAYYKIEQGKTWDFRDDIMQLAKEIFKENFRLFASAGLTPGENRELLDDLLKEVIKLKENFVQQMNNIATRSQNEIDVKGIDADNLGAKFKTITNYLTKKIKQPKKDDDYKPSKRIEEALESIENWYAKSAKKNIILEIESVYNVLSNCLHEAVSLYSTGFNAYKSAKVVLSNFHAFGILSDIAALLPEYRIDNNTLLISDTTAMLKDIIAGNDAPFIYEKVGNRYQNILIDEFQDTSAFQWENFKPLIENSLSNALFNLIVGDIKQSIYRWRNGDWKLLLYGVENHIGKNMITEKTLDTNWRSKKNILDFNNALFFSAPRLIQDKLNNELEILNDNTAQQKLIDAGYKNMVVDSYSDSYQHLPANKEKAGGRVSVKFFKVINRNHISNKWREQLPNYLPHLIDDLIENKNYSPRDITLLVRKNREGQDLVKMLIEHQLQSSVEYDIISSESLYVEQSPAVQVLICALNYLRDDSDSINLTSLVHKYLYLHKKVANLNEVFSIAQYKENLDEYLPDEFVHQLDNLKKLQLYELVNQLTVIFGLNAIKNEQPYLRTFGDAVISYIQNYNSDLYGFLEWWKTEGEKLSLQLSDEQDAVRILTIHKAKGLAFKVVIVPFCDWTLDHSSHFTSPVIWCNTNSKPYDKYPVLPVKYQSGLGETVFQLDYFDEKVQSYIDSLNLLYVALTRPVNELHIMAPIDEKAEIISQVSDLLYHSIANEVPGGYPQSKEKVFKSLRDKFINITNLYENDDNYKIQADKSKSGDIQQLEIDWVESSNWRQKLTMEHHSSDFFIQSIDFVADRVNYGTLMHSIMSQITTFSDVDQAIQDIYFSGKISSAQKDKIRQKVFSILNRPEIKDWFSTSWTVKNETALLTADGNLRIPDRVLFSDNQTIVIDFKFGKEHEEHQQQVKEYMQLMQDMNYPGVKGYLYYAEENKKVEVSIL